jgi:hypothetical protein
MTDKPTFHPKPGRIEPARLGAAPSKPAPRKGGFDPGKQGHWTGGPKGPKGKPVPLPGKSRGRG